MIIMELIPEIAITSTRLHGESHHDPADQIIIATTMVSARSLLTSASNIINYPHNAIRFILDMAFRRHTGECRYPERRSTLSSPEEVRYQSSHNPILDSGVHRNDGLWDSGIIGTPAPDMDSKHDLKHLCA